MRMSAAPCYEYWQRSCLRTVPIRKACDPVASNPIDERVVAVERHLGAHYPTTAPFHPSTAHPECPFRDVGPHNAAYELVRSSFLALGLDAEHYGRSCWDPLGCLVNPGDKVVVKPNLLFQCRKGEPTEWLQVVTHGSVVRAVIDYVVIALQGCGSIMIADGPQYDADWDLLIRRTGLAEVCEYVNRQSEVPVALLDLRDKWIDCRGDVKYGERPLPGDPGGRITVDLGRHSRLLGHVGEGRYHGSDYDRAETNAHHSGLLQEYELAATAISADVFINVPKMKTHKKVGVTLSLKNLVGINCGRNWMPHFAVGDPSTGGDQYPAASLRNASERFGITRLQRMTQRHPSVAPAFRFAKRLARPLFGDTATTIRSGNWYGNDTCWRMVHDINRALMYWGADGSPVQRPKRYLSVVDGITSGEGRGPEDPDALDTGVIVTGFNPVAVDCVAATLMGFDPRRIPLLARVFDEHDLPLGRFGFDDICIKSNVEAWDARLSEVDPASCFAFKPHFGWSGRIELNGRVERVERRPVD